MESHGRATTVAATRVVIKLTSGYKANEWADETIGRWEIKLHRI